MTKHPDICFECGVGRYSVAIEDNNAELPEGDILVVPKVRVLRCNKCGEVTIPFESSRQIDEAIDAHQETLTPAEVNSFLDKFGVDQTEAAEIMGFGAKTIHRWARGTQRVSRSMGIFLRTVMAHPELFEWIKRRSWRQSAPISRSKSRLKVADLRKGKSYSSDAALRKGAKVASEDAPLYAAQRMRKRKR